MVTIGGNSCFISSENRLILPIEFVPFSLVGTHINKDGDKHSHHVDFLMVMSSSLVICFIFINAVMVNVGLWNRGQSFVSFRLAMLPLPSVLGPYC